MYRADNDAWHVEKNALNINLEDRMIKDVNPAFLLKIKKGESRLFYVEGKTISSHIGEFLIFSSEEYFRPQRLGVTQFYIIYSVVLFTVMLLISLLFYMIKEKLYIYYVGYVLAFVVWLSILSGYYIYLGFPNWDEGLHASGTLIIAFLVLFSSEFLNLKKYLPKIASLFHISAIVIFVSGILIVLKIPHISLFFNIFSSLFFMLLFGVVIYMLKKDYDRSIRIYFVALMIYMISMGLMTSTFNAIINNSDFSRYSYVFGSLIEVFFFSFVLASRFNIIKNDRIDLQKELLNQKSRNEILLEQKVSDRTAELLKTNRELLEQKFELELTKEKLVTQSITDGLSGLYNRHYFNEISKMLYSSSKRENEELSILMLDIDKFKNVNDTYGHSIGDKILVGCSRVFKDIARESDVVIRYGGEEFLILLPKTGLEDALVMAEGIKNSIEDNKIDILNSNLVSVTISIGVSKRIPSSDKDIESIIKRADEALYLAKENGRNRIETIMRPLHNNKMPFSSNFTNI